MLTKFHTPDRGVRGGVFTLALTFLSDHARAYRHFLQKCTATKVFFISEVVSCFSFILVWY